MSAKGDAVRKLIADEYRNFCRTYGYVRIDKLVGEDQSILALNRARKLANKPFHKNCNEAIAAVLEEFGSYRCECCGCDKYRRRRGQLMVTCVFCKHRQLLTKTVQFFHQAKSLHLRLFYFQLLRKGFDFKCKQFSDALGMSSNTGIMLENKTNQAALMELKKSGRLASAPLKEIMAVFTSRQKLTGFNNTLLKERRARVAAGNPALTLSESDQLLVLKALRKGPVHFEKLITVLDLSASRGANAVVMLELRGKVINAEGGLVCPL